MKLSATARTQREGEAQVAKLIAQIGHNWRRAGDDSIGLDGYVETVKAGVLTGQLIGIQVKSGRSYLISYKGQEDCRQRLPVTRRRITLEEGHLSYFKLCRFPVLVVFCDPISGNAFWGEVAQNSTTSFLVPNTLDRYSARSLKRVADHWHSNYPELVDPETPGIPISALKRESRVYYDQLRQHGVQSPAYGFVRFTLRGWRHITRQNLQRSKMRRSLELLGAAAKILREQEDAHVCRKTDSGHILCKQTARILNQNRSDAIVSVITERIGNGPPQFLSVYEHGKRRAKSPSDDREQEAGKGL